MLETTSISMTKLVYTDEVQVAKIKCFMVYSLFVKTMMLLLLTHFPTSEIITRHNEAGEQRVKMAVVKLITVNDPTRRFSQGVPQPKSDPSHNMETIDGCKPQSKRIPHYGFTFCPPAFSLFPGLAKNSEIGN